MLSDVSFRGPEQLAEGLAELFVVWQVAKSRECPFTGVLDSVMSDLAAEYTDKVVRVLCYKMGFSVPKTGVCDLKKSKRKKSSNRKTK